MMQTILKTRQTKAPYIGSFGLPGLVVSPYYQAGRGAYKTTMKAVIVGLAPNGATPGATVSLWDGSGNFISTFVEPITFSSSNQSSDQYKADIITGVIAGILSDYSVTLLNSEISFLDGLLSNRSQTSPSVSIVTGTGATGTQISATRDAELKITLSTSTTATIGGASTADVVVELCATNSATAGDWAEKGRIGNSQTITLALALQSVQVIKGQVSVYVPAGYYYKLRSILGTNGSASVVSAQQILL